MPHEPDQHEGRVEPIEQTLERLNAEMRHFRAVCQWTVEEARLMRLRAEEARLTLRRERLRALERRKSLVARKDR
jgi:regulator of replication initiation timing